MGNRETTNQNGLITIEEILTQTNAWQSALDEINLKKEALIAFWQREQFSEIIFTGCGSTYYLSLSVASLFQQITGLRTRAVPASELWFFPDTILVNEGKTLLVAISRSGRTTETLKASQAFKNRGNSSLLTITTEENSPLVLQSDFSLIAREGKEKSVVQTRSFSSMLVLAQAWASLSAQDNCFLHMYELPSIGNDLITNNHDLAKELGRNPNFERFFFLGSGLQYGLACEANLKMKEMSLSSSEAFHFMEFRHGPMSLVDNHTLIVGLLSERLFAHELAVLEEMRALGAQTMILTTKNDPKSLSADYVISFGSDLEETIAGVLYLPILQLLPYYHALYKGLNPDRPVHLNSVVDLNDRTK